MYDRQFSLPRFYVLLVGVLCGGISAPVHAQTPDAQSPNADSQKAKQQDAAPSNKTADDIGVDIDAQIKARKKAEARKPDLELRAIRTSPSDSVTYFKKNHWTHFHLVLVGNNRDETVEIRSGYEPMHSPRLEGADSPHEVRYRRLVHLLKEQERQYRLPAFLSSKRDGKSIDFGLYYPEGVLPIEPPGIDRQPCTLLEPDQFLLVVLGPDSDRYRFLSNMQCIAPGSDADDTERLDRRRYYHTVYPMQPSRPIVADSALGWTSTAYVVWDDMDPELLSLRQQEAMIDWLHWGGQLIISGGPAATKLSPQSFLGPYIPAEVIGSGELSDFRSLAAKHLSPRTLQHPQPTLKPLHVQPEKPLYVARLTPKPGAVVTEELNEFPLVVEMPVGRGRVVMSAFSLTEADMVNWREGYDTFWRTALLKVPETPVNPKFSLGSEGRSYIRLNSSALTRIRYLARDLGGGSRRVGLETLGVEPNSGFQLPQFTRQESGETLETVAEWRDDTLLPSVARQTMLEATGIKIPPPDFVLVAAASYLLVLVPLNWFICRFVLRRPEWAWLAAPVIIVAFSVGIVRFAKITVGFDMTSHEINVVECFPGYPRAHTTRFTCIYSGSRRRCEFRYDDVMAVSLPMSTGQMQRGQNIERVSLDWDLAAGVPLAMGRYEIHPRSIGMIRSEEMINLPDVRLGQGDLPGGFHYTPPNDSTPGSLSNQTTWDLWDCHVVTATERIPVGDLPRGATIELVAKTQFDNKPTAPSSDDAKSAKTPATRIAAKQVPLVKRWLETHEPGKLPVSEQAISTHSSTEELGDFLPLRMMEALEAHGSKATRLVGWMPDRVPGQDIDPRPDRTIGFTIFVIELNQP